MSNDLNSRATACFEWRAGMVDTDGMVCLGAGPGCDVRFVEAYQRDAADECGHRRRIMYTSDQGTLGHMLAQVREALGSPCAQVSPMMGSRSPSRWVCYRNKHLDDGALWIGATEAEALIVAMEAAKGNR